MKNLIFDNPAAVSQSFLAYWRNCINSFFFRMCIRHLWENISLMAEKNCKSLYMFKKIILVLNISNFSAFGLTFVFLQPSPSAREKSLVKEFRL